MSTITSWLGHRFSWRGVFAPLARAPRRLLLALNAGLLPPTCCLCGFEGMRAGLDLCEVCAELLPANAEVSWDYPGVFSRALVPFEYAYPVDHFIRALKFRGERTYARVLGSLLAQAQLDSGAPLPPLLIPVPLHSSRYRSRGFNQAAQIARYAAAALGVRVDTGCLIRVIATHEQSRLSLAERQRNVRGAFRVLRPACAKHVALLDDVLTTGNTAAEAARMLGAAGIGTIELWAIARVR